MITAFRLNEGCQLFEIFSLGCLLLGRVITEGALLRTGSDVALFAMSSRVVLYCHLRIGPFRKLGKFADCLSPVVLDDGMVEREQRPSIYGVTHCALQSR